MIIVQIGSETDDISGLGPGPDQWSHQHQRDFQDFDKIRDTVCSTVSSEQRVVNTETLMVTRRDILGRGGINTNT